MGSKALKSFRAWRRTWDAFWATPEPLGSPSAVMLFGGTQRLVYQREYEYWMSNPLPRGCTLLPYRAGITAPDAEID